MSNLSRYTTKLKQLGPDIGWMFVGMIVAGCLAGVLAAGALLWEGMPQRERDITFLGGRLTEVQSAAISCPDGLPGFCDQWKSSANGPWSNVPAPQGSLAQAIHNAVTSESTIDGQMQALWGAFCPVARDYQLIDRTDFFVASDEDAGLQNALHASSQAAYLYEAIVSEMAADGWGFPPSQDGLPSPQLFPLAAAEQCK